MSSNRPAERSALLEHALGYPEAYLDHPWGEDVVKVRGRIFAFFGLAEAELSVSVKLPVSSPLALAQPFASATGYGLGKAGWVTARFAPHDEVPLALLRDWIDESYRAIAPRKLADAAPRR